MSEMTAALNMMRRLPKNHLMQFPSGRWGFVGSVDARLLYIKADGSFPSQEELREIAQFGEGLIMKSRAIKHLTWATEAEAKAAG